MFLDLGHINRTTDRNLATGLLYFAFTYILQLSSFVAIGKVKNRPDPCLTVTRTTFDEDILLCHNKALSYQTMIRSNQSPSQV